MLPVLLHLTSLTLSTVLGATSCPAIRADSTIAPDTAQLPLTVDALHRMGTFWTRLLQEPAAVRDTGRTTNTELLTFTLAEVTLVSAVADPGVFRLQVVDMRAMAVKFPAVAADLAQVHLTALQWERYRRAIAVASLTDGLDQFNQAHGAPPTPAHASVTWRNVEFLRAHRWAFEELAATGMWIPKTQ